MVWTIPPASLTQLSFILIIWAEGDPSVHIIKPLWPLTFAQFNFHHVVVELILSQHFKAVTLQMAFIDV